MREDFYQSQYGDQQQLPTSAANATAAESQHLVVKKHVQVAKGGNASGAAFL